MKSYNEAIKCLEQDYSNGFISSEEYRTELMLIDDGISSYLEDDNLNLNDLIDIEFN